MTFKYCRVLVSSLINFNSFHKFLYLSGICYVPLCPFELRLKSQNKLLQDLVEYNFHRLYFYE